MKIAESQGIAPEELAAFLGSTGWTRTAEGRAGATWVLPSRDDAPAILLPKDLGDPSFASLMSSALERLAWVHEQDVVDIQRAIRTLASDTLEVRVIDPTTVDGRIGLKRGAKLAETLYEVVLNGLRVTRLGGRPWYGGPLPEGASELLTQFELLPPAVGSYRLEVVALAPLQMPFGDAPDPPLRETLRAALTALAETRGASARDTPDDADELDEPVSLGMSTNLLNALHALDTQSTQLSIEFSTRWSGGSERNVVRLESEHLARIPRLREVLKQHLPKEDFSLHGWIKTVSAQGIVSADQPLAGTVIVETRVDGKRRDVTVELTGVELRRAAAGLGEKFLTAKGTLEQIGRGWHLTGAEDIAIREMPAP
jgi:hypothetical protein